MPKQKKYKILAAFFMVVFSLNTVVGFACSVGIDMGFNSKHHHDDDATGAEVHFHSDGKKHIHSKSYHGQANNHHKSDNKKNDCCNDQVYQFEQLDKSVQHSLNIIHPSFLIAFFDVFYNVVLPSFGNVKDIKQFVRNYHPPIPDIRIAIQSFQI